MLERSLTLILVSIFLPLTCFLLQLVLVKVNLGMIVERIGMRERNARILCIWIVVK